MNDLGRVHYAEGGAPETSEDTGGVVWGGLTARSTRRERERKKCFRIIFLNKIFFGAGDMYPPPPPNIMLQPSFLSPHLASFM
jgi:hypothetical protein